MVQKEKPWCYLHAMDQMWSADRQGQGLWCQTFDADQKFFCTFLALLNNEMDFSNSSSIANLRWILIGAILLIKKSCFWVEEVESWRLSSFSRVGSFLFVALLLHINIPLMMPVVSTQCHTDQSPSPANKRLGLLIESSCYRLALARAVVSNWSSFQVLKSVVWNSQR